jgi:hypothetical protein
MKTTVVVNVSLQWTKRSQCMKTYDLPFRLQKGDSILLNDQDIGEVKYVYVDLETQEITAQLPSILIEKDNKEEYDATIRLLKNNGWRI